MWSNPRNLAEKKQQRDRATAMMAIMCVCGGEVDGGGCWRWKLNCAQRCAVHARWRIWVHHHYPPTHFASNGFAPTRRWWREGRDRHPLKPPLALPAKSTARYRNHCQHNGAYASMAARQCASGWMPPWLFDCARELCRSNYNYWMFGGRTPSFGRRPGW